LHQVLPIHHLEAHHLKRGLDFLCILDDA
jgi:hypothetical protein